jgi:3-methyladenine DNA glycosylase AlkD
MQPRRRPAATRPLRSLAVCGLLFGVAIDDQSRRPVAATRSALEWLERERDVTTLENMSARYGIHTDRAIGVPMARMKVLAKALGTDHALAAELWASGWYEARIVASMVDDADVVTPEQMDAWCEDFDNWAIVDTVCFNLFDRTAHAWSKVDQWATSDHEFIKRAGFALLWSLALHDREAPDDRFVHGLGLIEREAGDGRHLVDKAVGMALRAIGKRRSSLTLAAISVAENIAKCDDPAARRVGRVALNDLRRAAYVSPIATASSASE